MDSKTIGYIEAMLNERVNTSRQRLLSDAADNCTSEASVVRSVQDYRRALAARDDFCEWAEMRKPDKEAE